MPLPGFGLGVEITGRVYKPRPPRESPLFRLVEQHLAEQLLALAPERRNHLASCECARYDPGHGQGH